jgi:hypothetical protein
MRRCACMRDVNSPMRCPSPERHAPTSRPTACPRMPTEQQQPRCGLQTQLLSPPPSPPQLLSPRLVSLARRVLACGGRTEGSHAHSARLSSPLQALVSEVNHRQSSRYGCGGRGRDSRCRRGVWCRRWSGVRCSCGDEGTRMYACAWAGST